MEKTEIVSPKEIHRCAIEHGWYEGVEASNLPKDFIPSKLALIHSEVSEALQYYRIGQMREFNEEMADVVIRVFDLCAFLGIDIADEIEGKHVINLARPYKHGGKLV